MLPVGITNVVGDFEAGSTVAILNQQHKLMVWGLWNILL
ncbi:hypothetical protein ACX0G7_10195 [Flavitalea antarctica]